MNKRLKANGWNAGPLIVVVIFEAGRVSGPKTPMQTQHPRKAEAP